jgi:Cu+-exporting ATPase
VRVLVRSEDAKSEWTERGATASIGSLGDPRSIADALRLARRTLRTIRQNFFWAYAYNVALVPLAALALVSPVLAAAAMSASSLFVLGKSLRLKRAI